MKITIIGTGNIGSAIALGLAKGLSENKHYIFHYYIVQNFLKAS
jgi:predicted dinucleotide-binding enzyme